MTPDEYRTAAHRLVDWVADYRSGIADLPVQAQVKPGEIVAALAPTPPEQPEPLDALIADLDRIVVPGLTMIQHPRYFAWFPSNQSLSSALGDMVSTGLGALGITWQSAPALTEVEQVMCDWLRQLVGLSDAWSGTIHDTASTGMLVAMLCARERTTDHGQAAGGLQAEAAPLVVYASAQAHSAVPKAVLLAGFGRDNLRTVATDDRYAMDAAALEAAIVADLAAGRRPCAVVATVGTTGTTAIDPLLEIGAVARRHGLWLHVDAALAGSAMILPDYRPLWEGVEAADSLGFNPHKWLGTALDCSMYYVRDVEHLVRVMSTNPSYLQGDGSVQYKDWGIPLGRRFRALKLWFHLRLEGAEALRARLRRDLANARWLAEAVAATPGWRVLAPVPLQLVCIRHEPEGLEGDALDAHTLGWAGDINASGAALVTPSMLDGRWMVRISIGAEPTERSDVEAVWALIQETAEARLVAAG